MTWVCELSSLRLGAVLALLAIPVLAPAQTDTQTPAPIVRVRPRPQGTSPGTAPADAAPLVSRPPRPHPVNPQALSGAPASSGQTTTATRPRPAATTGGATAATGAVARPTAAASGTATPAHTAPGTQPEHAAAPPKLSPILNRNIVVLDPAHGAQDSGSRIGDNILEKDVTLAFAFRLRSLLAARGFTVALTREADAATQPNSPNAPLTLDDRAGIANKNRAAACLLIHATGRGNGVHLYTSELDAAPGEVPLLPWLTAQASWVPASQQLERSVSSALGRSHISLVSSAASIRPVDSLTCPALVLELAPENDNPRSILEAGYQDRIAGAIAGALIFWQNQVQPPVKLTATPGTHTAPHHRATAPKPAGTSGEAQP